MIEMRDDLERQAESLLAACRARGLTVATAESCTGGLVAATMVAIPGSSDVLDRGFVTYSNEAKAEMLGVDAALIAAEGAVSKPVALAMAEGARTKAGTDLAVAITGVAGPGGGSDAKPVGLVHFACIGPAGLVHQERRFGAIGRREIREEAVAVALAMLADQAILTP